MREEREKVNRNKQKALKYLQKNVETSEEEARREKGQERDNEMN